MRKVGRRTLLRRSLINAPDYKFQRWALFNFSTCTILAKDNVQIVDEN